MVEAEIIDMINYTIMVMNGVEICAFVLIPYFWQILGLGKAMHIKMYCLEYVVTNKPTT